jgi:hypothetical protein
MFYCEECRKSTGWPERLLHRSWGACEICGRVGICNDVPTSNLVLDLSDALEENKEQEDPGPTRYTLLKGSNDHWYIVPEEKIDQFLDCAVNGWNYPQEVIPVDAVSMVTFENPHIHN